MKINFATTCDNDINIGIVALILRCCIGWQRSENLEQKGSSNPNRSGMDVYKALEGKQTNLDRKVLPVLDLRECTDP